MVDVKINGARILQALAAKRLKVAEACALLGVNNKTLKKMIEGKRPQRLDAFYRVIEGLQIPCEEVLIAATYKTTEGPRLYLVSRRRKSDKVA